MLSPGRPVFRFRKTSFPPHNNPGPHIDVVLPVIQKGRAEARGSRHKIPHLPSDRNWAEHIQINPAAVIEYEAGVRAIPGIGTAVYIRPALRESAEADAAHQVRRKTAAWKYLQFQSGCKNQRGVGSRQQDV